MKSTKVKGKRGAESPRRVKRPVIAMCSCPGCGGPKAKTKTDAEVELLAACERVLHRLPIGGIAADITLEEADLLLISDAVKFIRKR